MDLLDKFTEKAKSNKLTLVLPEGHDERIIQAGRLLTDRELAKTVILLKMEL